jgi:hypothetical protein
MHKAITVDLPEGLLSLDTPAADDKL